MTDKANHAGCYACGGGMDGFLVSRSPMDLDCAALTARCGKTPDRLVGVALCAACDATFARRAA